MILYHYTDASLKNGGTILAEGPDHSDNDNDNGAVAAAASRLPNFSHSVACLLLILLVGPTLGFAAVAVIAILANGAG